MNKHIIRQIINCIAVILTIVVNGLAIALPLNNQTTGEISNRFHLLFVPAGYVFSIWSLIYLGLIVFTIYQALPSQRENQRLARIGYLFALSCLANIAWLFLWHYEQFVLTLVAMFSLLGLLIAIYLILRVGKAKVSKIEKWLIYIPFSVYLSWVTVATIANVTTTLNYLNWDGWGISPETWALTMLITGTIIASIVNLTRNDAAFVLVIIWAFIGIGVKQADTPLISIAAYILSGLLAVGLLTKALRKYRHSNIVQ